MILLKSYNLDHIKLFLMEEEDIGQLIKCKNIVVNDLKDPGLFIAPDDSYIATILSGYGKIIGILYDKVLIGFASIVFPKLGKHNLGYILNYNDILLKKVAQFEHGLIIRTYRGYGFLKLMLKELFQHIPRQYTLLLSTVSPKNIPSLKTGFSIGQVIVARVSYKGYDRFILFRDFNNTVIWDNNIIICDNLNELNSYLIEGYFAIYDSNQKYYILSKEISSNETL